MNPPAINLLFPLGFVKSNLRSGCLFPSVAGSNHRDDFLIRIDFFESLRFLAIPSA
jgi:hypothetical protein